MHVSCIHVRAWWGRKGEKLKNDWFLNIFEGVKEATGNLKPAAGERAEPLWGHFGSTSEALWRLFGGTLEQVVVCSGDFGPLSDHVGIIVESLWVFRDEFQKTLIFAIDFNDFIKLWG